MKYFICLLGLALNFQFFAQTEFVPGFYIVNNNAKYAQIQFMESNYMPYIPKSIEEVDSYGENIEFTEDGPVVTCPEGYLYYGDYTFVTSNTDLQEGQIVIAYMISNNRIYCFDMHGNSVVFSGINDLTKAPNNGSIGQMGEDFEELMEGPTLHNGFYWILSQNTTNGTVKIQLPNTTVDIKAEKIMFWKKQVSKAYDNAFETNNDEGIIITTVK